MIVTITNTSGGTLNDLDVHDGGSGAVGGARKDPLPHPFGHIGALANTATSVLPMHPQDWRYKRVPWLPMEPRDDWNTLVQAGKVTVGLAAQTNVRENESLAMNTI